MQLAGSIMANANSASAVMAGEKSSGARSWDNESIRNKNNDNVSSNKHDSSMQYVSGAARSMMSDGSMEMIRPDGKAVYFGGAGQSTSSGETRYNEGRGFSVNGEQSMRHENQAMSSETATRSQAHERTMSQGADAMYTIMESTKSDNGYNIDTSAEEGKEIAHHLNEVDRLSKSNDYGWRQNAEAYLKADYSAGGAAAKAFGIDVGGGGKTGAENSSSQNDSNASEMSEDKSINDRKSNTERVNKIESIMQSHGVDKNTQNSIRESYQEVERLDKSIAEHKSNIDSHTKTMNYAQSNSGEMSKDITQDVADHYQKLYGGSARQAHEAVSSKTDKAEEAFKDLTSSKYQEKFNEIKSQGEQIKSSNNINDFAGNNQIDSSIGGETDKWAKMNNINTQAPEVAEQEIGNKRERIKDAHDTKYKANQGEYKKTENELTKSQEGRQETIDKHEKNRIGREGPSNIVGGLGRPVEKTNYDDELGDPIGKLYKPKAVNYNWKTGGFEPLTKAQ
jgi:hypothetical protein